jgi:spore coat protein CotH
MARPVRQPQLDFIRGYIDDFEQAARSTNFRHPVTGRHYSEFIDVDAWIDHHILNVLAKNVDGLRYSTYFHKDRNGRLAAGPVWDFDRSFGTFYDQRATEPAEWSAGWRNAATYFDDGWWRLLFADPAFVAQYRTRFLSLLDNEFSPDSLDRIVDALAAEVGPAAERNFRRWVQTPPVENSYAAEVAIIKDFLRRRAAWIKVQLQTNF